MVIVFFKNYSFNSMYYTIPAALIRVSARTIDLAGGLLHAKVARNMVFGLAGLFAPLAAVAVVAAPADDFYVASKLYQHGKLEQAMSKVNAGLAAQPKDARGRFLKGPILTEQKKIADAIQTFTGLTEDYPALPEPYNNLAVLYAGQGNYHKVKVALELAVHTHPSYATAHENVGDIYAQLARRAYDKALQFDKSNLTAQSKLAMVKEMFTVPTPAVATATKIEPAKTAAATTPAK
jgi:tetratricopeptide (TPR) repeat protein